MMTSHSREILELLREFESRNVTYIAEDGSWPIVWERARGVFVWDRDGKKYLDLTAAFGVAAAGHANRRVVQAGQKQMARLLHAMGDVHPHPLKAKLARELSAITFEKWAPQASPAKPELPRRLTAKTIFGNSGFEAVEAALKTAMLATHKPGIVAFAGGYHGLGYGALNVTSRDHFRSHFHQQLREFGSFVSYPTLTNELAGMETRIRSLFRRKAIGAILVEPIQVRGGSNVPAPEFLPILRSLADEFGALLILDEIYTGFGRTGFWFACEQSQTIPDLICLGKALTGGFPLSACVGRADIMDAAWPLSGGEAIHTSTFLGHPVGCAMALAQIQEIREQNLPARSQRLGEQFLAWLKNLKAHRSLALAVRGQGLLVGLELRTHTGQPATDSVMRIIKQMLKHGYILLPEGEYANVISFTPPLIISVSQLRQTVARLAVELAAVKN